MLKEMEKINENIVLRLRISFCLEMLLRKSTLEKLAKLEEVVVDKQTFGRNTLSSHGRLCTVLYYNMARLCSPV